MSLSGVHYTIFSLAQITPIIDGRGGRMGRLVISRTVGLPRSIAVSERKTQMIAYTAWDSLQALAQQYDADLVIAPEERVGLRMRPTHSASRATSANACAPDSRFCKCKPYREETSRRDLLPEFPVT